MNQIAPTTSAAPLGSSVTTNPMGRLATVVRSMAADLLCASDTRLLKITSDGKGWSVEVEVFAPNPELTVSMRGGAKSILERSRHRMFFDLDMQLTALEPVEE